MVLRDLDNPGLICLILVTLIVILAGHWMDEDE